MRDIPLTPVESSQLEAIGHDPDTNTLAIRFKGYGGKPGSVYHYQNYTAAQFQAFQAAESKGSFFKAHIRHATEAHPYEKVPVAPPAEAAAP